MPLNDPVPSTAADVLEYNAERFDEVLNSNNDTYTDRLGVERKTAHALETAIDQAESGIIAGAWVYQSVAAGEAARVDGDYFWVVSADDSEVLELWLMGAVTATDTGKRTVNKAYVDSIKSAISSTQEIGKQTPDTGIGTTVSASTYLLDDSFASDGNIKSISANVSAASTIKVRVFERSGDTFTQVGADKVVSLEAGLNQIELNMPVLAGQYVGFYIAVTRLYRDSFVDGDTPWRWSNGTDATTFTDATSRTNIALQIGFGVQYISVTAEDFKQAQTDIESLQSESADHGRQLSVQNSIYQVVGQKEIAVGASTLSAGTYIMSEEVAADGVLENIKLYTTSPNRNYHFKIFRRNGAGTEQVGSDIVFPTSSGTNTFGLNLEVKKGDLFGFYIDDALNLARTAKTTTIGYNFVAGNATSNPITNPQYSNEFSIQYNVKLVGAKFNSVSIANSDRVVVLGDSHTESDYTPKGKAWISKVSAFTGFCFDNFAKSGDTILENIQRLENGTRTLSILPFKDRAATYAMIYCGQNDAAAYTLPNFFEYMRQCLEIVTGLGLIPIISTQHTDTYGIGSQLIFKKLADDFDGYFIDVTPNCRVMDNGTRYAGFYAGTHLATRTNEQIAVVFEKFFKEQLHVNQSLKLFRHNSSFTITDIGDLYYYTDFERNKRFQEILVGQGALVDGSLGKIDEANTIGSGDFELLDSEYTELQVGGSIDMPEYSLLEVVFPTNKNNLDYLMLEFNDPALTVYVRDVLGDRTSGEPIGNWSQLTGVDGVFSLSKEHINAAIVKDKLSVLIYKAGGITGFKQPVVKWLGQQMPKHRKISAYQPKVSGAELLSNTDMADITAWTATGSLTPAVPADGMLPRQSTGMIEVDNSNFITQAITYAESETEDREVEVRIRCRYFPSIVNSATYPTGAEITDTSFDYRTAQLDVTNASGTTSFKDKVGLWWSDVIFRVPVSILTTSMDLSVKCADGIVQVAYVSAKLVE